jgi:GNAT superfamily N-acetyltransferase
MMNTAVTIPNKLVTTSLEITTPAAFRPAYINDPEVQIVKMEKPDVRFYRFLYNSVGEQWRWRDRNFLADEELEATLSAPGTSVYVMYVAGVPAGYVELSRQGQSTEIAYFGLRPDFMGQGLGKHLLSFGIAQAWNDGTRRVWVHTCNLDAPYALENYMKRGMKIFHMEEKPMPERYA